MHDQYRYRETDPVAINQLLDVAFWEQYPNPRRRAKAFKRWHETIEAKWGEVDWPDLDFVFWVGDDGALGLTVTRAKPPLPLL